MYSTCALNSKLIGMYKSNVLGFRPTQFHTSDLSRFMLMPGFSAGSMHVFVHEAPGD